MSKIYRNFIGGEWVESNSGRTTPNLNPSNENESLGDVPLSTSVEALAAVEAAKEAFKTWRKVPSPKRGDIVARAAQLIAERADVIAESLSREEGKILKEAKGEVQKTVNVVEYLAGEGRRLSGVSRESELAKNYAFTRREPLGVCGLITPWNFPVAIPAWKIAPAIVTGNTVVLKASEFTPETAEHVVQAFIDAGVPPGVVNLVHGLGDEAGSAIVESPDVAALSFTGSTRIGLQIYARGAARGVPVQCEMGGKNPIIVLADGNVDMAAAAAVMGGFGSTGQRCTATSRAIVHSSVADEFVEGVLSRIPSMVAGDPLHPETTLGPLVNKNQLERVLSYLEVGRSEADLRAGGNRLTEGSLANGYFVEPTLFDNVSPNHRIAKEEIFGPVISVLRVDSFEEAIAVANNVDYGLSSSIYTNDYARVFEYAEEIETGICHVNSPTIGGEAHLPFGGMKQTGIGGREMNEEAIEFYTEIKTVYFDYTGAGRTSSVY